MLLSKHFLPYKKQIKTFTLPSESVSNLVKSKILLLGRGKLDPCEPCSGKRGLNASPKSITQSKPSDHNGLIKSILSRCRMLL